MVELICKYLSIDLSFKFYEILFYSGFVFLGFALYYLWLRDQDKSSLIN
jgi:hypothetical protein